jgi:hypothetical protein
MPFNQTPAEMHARESQLAQVGTVKAVESLFVVTPFPVRTNKTEISLPYGEQ